MANKNKAKGTRAESRIVKYLNENGIKATRQALSGSLDKGDVYLEDYKAILEVKTGKQTWNPNRAQIEEWCRQARAEAYNSGMKCALVVVRYKRHLNDADVYLQHKLPGFGITREHMYLDEFVRFLKDEKE